MNDDLEPPYPWFGGKSTVMPEVWARFGPVRNFVDPFCGSGASITARQGGCTDGVETVNDLDGFVSNFWRAVKADPDAVADGCDYMVDEVTLEARHRFLCRQPGKNEFLLKLRHDPDYFDAKRAAYWCWGLCCWIGRGWCAGEYHGLDAEENHGQGVCNDARKRPHLGRGHGVNRQRPHLGHGGHGVNRSGLLEYMRDLHSRWRKVRVCCGDWSRVLTDTPLLHAASPTAVFLDPPYLVDVDGKTRDADIYREESADVAHVVREWAIANGKNPELRIALCGYEGEHVMPHSWDCWEWKAQGGYANTQASGDNGLANRRRERIWFSPHCRPQAQGSLFLR